MAATVRPAGLDNTNNTGPTAEWWSYACGCKWYGSSFMLWATHVLTKGVDGSSAASAGGIFVCLSFLGQHNRRYCSIVFMRIVPAGLIFVAYCVVCYLVTALLFSLLILDLAALVITVAPSKSIFKYTDLVYTGDSGQAGEAL